MMNVTIKSSLWPLLTVIYCRALYSRVGAVARISPTSSSYDEKQARLHLQFNSVAICTSNRIEAWSCGEACDATRPFISNGSQVVLGPTGWYGMRGYVVRLEDERQPDRCMATFAGTSFYDYHNILADALFVRKAWPAWIAEAGRCTAADWCDGCSVSHGFADAYAELRDPLLQAVKHLRCRSVEIVGHSLGGVMAMLASMELRACHNETVSVEQVWTYGMPRAGNEAFAEKYISVARAAGEEPPMWRVVHADDLIPQVPPYWAGFRHPGREVYYPTENASSFKVCRPSVAGSLEDPGCSFSVWQGTMEHHHAYLGFANLTDENTVSEQCISAAAMGRKQSAWNTFLVCALASLVLLCALSSLLCWQFCGRCVPGVRDGKASSDRYSPLWNVESQHIPGRYTLPGQTSSPQKQ